MEEPTELGGHAALGTSQEVQALDLRLEILVFCGVAKLRHLVGGDGNAGNMLYQKIAFFNFLFIEFLSDCYVSHTP